MRKSFLRALFFCLVTGLFLETESFALDRKLSSALTHYIMGVLYEDFNEVEQAVYEYKKALKLDPKNPVIHSNLAASYIKDNKALEAIEELKLAIELDPGAVEPHAVLALLYSSQNELELGIREYETALSNAVKLNPENIGLYKSLAAIYTQQKKFLKAEETYNLIITFFPQDAEAHFRLAAIYNELKDNASAESELKKALELNPDYHEALNFLGYFYIEDGRNLDQAEILVKKALELDPSNGAYVDSLGWLYYKKGMFKEAVDELEKAVFLLQDAVIYDHLGDAYLQIGDHKSAELNWQRAINLDPGMFAVRKKIEGLCSRNTTNTATVK